MQGFTITCAVLAALAAICAILTFVDKKKTQHKEEGCKESAFAEDVRYLTRMVENIQSDVKEMQKEQSKRNVDAGRQDERLRAIENRIKILDNELLEIKQKLTNLIKS